MPSTETIPTPLAQASGATPEKPARRGLARLGWWAAGHLRAVLVLWRLILAGFGVFAPRVESALSGAGWQDSGSQSVAARAVIAKNFHGLGATALQVVVHDGAAPIANGPAARRAIGKVEALLKADPRVGVVLAPRPGVSLSRDGRTAIVQAGAAAGRVVIAAAGVMVAVFLTFALSGPLAPKEMGIILAVAVFLDALCIRLIVLPVVLRLTGHAAWRAPRWLARALPDMRFSH